jgi:hypothetical protein
MGKTLVGTSPVTTHIASHSLLRGIGWGAMGGLAGTLVMDILLMGALRLFGQPASLCFQIVGDTVSSFLALFGLQVAGGIPIGVLTHYVVGPLFGLLFGAAVTMFPALREGTLMKTTIAAIIYVEILSLPILAMTPLLLKMKAPDTLIWFGGSFVMHLIFGVVLGVFVGYGLRCEKALESGAAAC